MDAHVPPPFTLEEDAFFPRSATAPARSGGLCLSRFQALPAGANGCHSGRGGAIGGGCLAGLLHHSPGTRSGVYGAALFLPGLLFLLPAGHVADRFDRRQIILICYGLQILCTFGLLSLTHSGSHGVHPIYAVLFLIGTARAFSGPASFRSYPSLGAGRPLRQRGNVGRRYLPVCQHRWSGGWRPAVHAVHAFPEPNGP